MNLIRIFYEYFLSYSLAFRDLWPIDVNLDFDNADLSVNPLPRCSQVTLLICAALD